MSTNTLYSKNNPLAQPRAAQVSVPSYGQVLCQTTLYGQDGQVLCQTTLYGQDLGKTQPPAAQPLFATHPRFVQPPQLYEKYSKRVLLLDKLTQADKHKVNVANQFFAPNTAMAPTAFIKYATSATVFYSGNT